MKLKVLLLITAIAILSAPRARAADSIISALSELTTPATDDMVPIVDKSDTTQAASGSTKKIQVTNLINDTAFASSWNGVTTISASKNAIYDWAHIFDTDDDGKVNVLDQAVGIAITDSSGVLQTPVTTSALLASAISDETGTGVLVYGTGPSLSGPDLIGTTTIGADPALSASHITVGTTGLIFEGSTADTAETLLTVSDPSADRTITLPNATGTVVLQDTTDTLTGKTIDASATGNTLKQTKYINLQRPDYGDGAGAVPQTNTFTASGLMHYTFSGNAETNVNWVVYEFDCPPDLDTSVELTARFAFLSGGTDADDYVFHLTYSQVAAGTAYVTGTSIATSPIVMTVTPTTAANGDVQQSSAVTLTGWAAALTAGRPMQVRVARLQNAQDDGARDIQLVIAYGSTL